jgi:hypothetical protein
MDAEDNAPMKSTRRFPMPPRPIDPRSPQSEEPEEPWEDPDLSDDDIELLEEIVREEGRRREPGSFF